MPTRPANEEQTMPRHWPSKARWALLTLVAAIAWPIAGAPMQQEQRDALNKAFNAGNYKNAYEGIRKLALDPLADPTKISADLELGIRSLQRLGRVEEVDDFREAV